MTTRNRASGSGRPGLAERYGLSRTELRAWAMYDWANSAFMTTIVAAVFPVYFSQVAAADLDGNVATYRFSLATTIALAIVAVIAPVLGALADRAAMKKRLLLAFQSIGVAHPKWTPLLEVAGKVIAFAFALGFASFPLYFLVFRSE